jgi:hypothetical protein
MHDISLIPAFCPTRADTFYSFLEGGFNKLLSLSCASYYHIFDTPQPLSGIRSGALRSLQKSLTERSRDRFLNREFFNHAGTIAAEFDDRFIAFLQDFSFHEPKRSLNFTVATRWRRRRSHSFTLQARGKKDGSARQERRKYAASTENLRAYQKCKTLTDRGLRSFLLTLLVRAWCVPAHRFNLQKSAPTEREAGRSTGCKNCTFLRWIDPHPDIPIVVQSAIFLQEGGAL